MGWERKRGKLAEFNRFVLTGERERASPPSWATRACSVRCATSSRSTPTPCCRPTQPRAGRSAGPPAQPRGVRSTSWDGWYAGYGILQPRVGVSLPSAHRSLFRRDPLGPPRRGSVHHRGLRRLPGPLRRGQLHRQGHLRRRRVRARHSRPLPREHAAVARPDRGQLRPRRARHRRDRLRRLPDPLPHLHPAQAPLDPRRLAASALAHAAVPGPDGPERNRLSLLSRWKILDNLRRSTVELAAARFLVAGWTLLPGSPLRWTLLGLLARRRALDRRRSLLARAPPPLDKSWRAYYAAVGRDAVTSAAAVALAIAFLPHQAWVSADAIVRTLWRLLVSPATPARVADRVADRARRHRRGPATRGARCGPRSRCVAWLRPSRSRLWPPDVRGAAVSVARWLWGLLAALSRMPSAGAAPSRREQRAAARRAGQRRCATRCSTGASSTGSSPRRPTGSRPTTSRRIPSRRRGDAHLAHQHRPPAAGHGQRPRPRLHHARGHDPPAGAGVRSLERMRRFRGHFYNWYDLHDLQVLEPAYVSTVDSGNLAGHLIALRQALRHCGQAGVRRRQLTTPPRVGRSRRRHRREMDFTLFYDERRELFSIGYTDDAPLDASYYDLLASEARLASFVAIARTTCRSSTGSISDARSHARSNT